MEKRKNLERGASIIELIRLNKSSIYATTVKEYEIIFLMTGSLVILYSDVILSIEKGYVTLIPPGSDIQVKSSEDSQFIIVRIHPRNLFEEWPLEIERSIEMNNDEESANSNTLEIRSGLWTFLGTLKEYIGQRVVTDLFLELKRKELGFLFHAYYSKKELANFFRMLATSDSRFTSFVLSNYQKVKNVTELASLSEYSLSGFEKHFKRVFGMSPGKWMKEQKAKIVYHQIKYGEQPFKFLAMEYGFSSVSYFNDYCKTNFGKTPSVLRKEKV